mgnify:CR=1 FL=1
MRRAVRAPAEAELGVDWVLPHWLERQRDPRSPAFVAGNGHANRTLRNWTTIGTVAAAGATGRVDPRGLVTAGADGWSLDWWIGAEDRWHFPSREAAVRQQLVAGTPVVETAMRIPGGDAVQRVYGVPGDLAVVEITNDTPTPIAVGLAVRPYHLTGRTTVTRIGLDDRTVIVDGRPAVLFAKRPQRMVASTFADGDAVHRVLAEDLDTELRSADRPCAAGLATATFLFPLAHRQTLRVAVVLDAGSRRPLALPDDLPDSDAVVRSWQAQTSSRGMRLVLPEGRLASTVEANRRHLLLLLPDGPTLDRYGFHQEAPGAGLTAQAERWRLTGSIAGVDAEAVAKAVGSIERRRRKHGGDHEMLRELLDGAALLRAIGGAAVADGADRWASALQSELATSAARLAERLTEVAAPGGPPRAIDTAALAVLDAPDHPAVAAAAQVVRDRFCIGSAVRDVIGNAGLDPRRTLQLATIELEAGDRAALERLAWLLDVASPTSTWPEWIHPVLGGGSSGDGHHGPTAAAFLTFVRRMLVRETADGGLALCSMLPDAWLGQGIEVHDAPTHHGPVSFAVRYHGDRPALLWDLKRRDERSVVRITAPGLDAAWSSTEAKGEALLAAPTAPIAAVSVEGSFS